MRRLAVGAVVVLGLIAAGLAYRVHRLGEELVEEEARLSKPRTRPIHREPAIAGSYEACLAPLIEGMPDGGAFTYLDPDDAKKEVSDVLDGGAPFAVLRNSTQLALNEYAPWARQVVGCSRASGSSTDIEGFGLFVSLSQRHGTAVWFQQPVTRVLGLEIRRALEDGDPGIATRLCADILAMGRDAPSTNGLIGAMLAESVATMSLRSCAAAVFAATPAQRQAFANEVAVIRAGLPSFRHVMEIERVEMQLIGFGATLSDSKLERLSTNAAELAREDEFRDAFKWGRTQQLLYWPHYRLHIDRVIAVAELPDRDEQLVEIEKSDSLFEPSGLGTSNVTYARRYDQVGRTLSLLESAARLSLGEAALPGVTVTEGAVSVPGLEGAVVSIPIPR